MSTPKPEQQQGCPECHQIGWHLPKCTRQGESFVPLDSERGQPERQGEFCDCLMPLGSKTCHHCTKPVRQPERQTLCPGCNGLIDDLCDECHQPFRLSGQDVGGGYNSRCVHCGSSLYTTQCLDCGVPYPSQEITNHQPEQHDSDCPATFSNAPDACICQHRTSLVHAVEPPKVPIGTRIRFPRDVESPANEEHPHLVYAYAGETGEIVGHNEWPHEGYMAKTDNWPHPFGISPTEFEVVEPPRQTEAPLEFAHAYVEDAYSKTFDSDDALVAFLIERLRLVEKANGDVYEFARNTFGPLL